MSGPFFPKGTGCFLSPSTHVGASYFAAADQSRMMQEQMTGAAMAMPADTNKAFKVHSLLLASLKLRKAILESYFKDGLPNVSVVCMVPSFKFKFSKNILLFLREYSVSKLEILGTFTSF